MHKYISKFLFFALCLAICLPVFSQEPPNTVEMADTMRSNGKIYVVVAVIVTLFSGIVLYLISLDRKIAKLEKAGKPE